MSTECLVLAGEGRQFWEVLARAKLLFFFLSIALYLFVLGRPDEILKETDLCWIAWLQQVPNVKIQANEQDPYEMLVNSYQPESLKKYGHKI